jgi:hypothetical protein
VLLRSEDGNAIKEMELGSPATRHQFDEVAADIRVMMPSSQYKYDSGSMKMNSFENVSQSSSATPEKEAKTTRRIMFFRLEKIEN